MTATSPSVELAPSIRSALAGVRRRIRAYVWLQGLALAVIWLGLTFWIGLALDYFPVLVWASEMPRAARAVLLAVIAAGLGWVVFRYLLRRAFVPISDRSLAVLLERQFDFHDSLVTAVELSGGRRDVSSYSTEMLGHTHADARQEVDRVALGKVFNYRPLMIEVAVALALVASIGAFYAKNAPALELAGERLYLLDDTPWPRSAAIEVVGVEVQHASPGEGRAATTQEINFDQSQSVKVGRGSAVTVRVRASAEKRLPETCIIYYRTADGDRGNVAMKKVGRVKEGYQYYAFDGKPFKGLLADLKFDVMGYDHRVRGYEISVVDSPALVSVEFDCWFPAYTQWDQRREQSLNPATPPLPIGTQIALSIKANKPLQRLAIYNPATQQTQRFEMPKPGEKFKLPKLTLQDNLTLEVTMQDADGVQSDRPQRLYIATVRDETPRVALKLAGISGLVTPDVIIPVSGEIKDDYDPLGKSWFDLQINDRDPETLPLHVARDGKVNQSLDFRDLRSSEEKYTLKPQDKISLVAAGQDKHDLEGGPHTGYGDRWEFVVVTPDELLASLEGRELALRRRFEQIITELTETRDELIRAAAETKPPPATAKAATSVAFRSAKVAQDPPSANEEGLSLSLRQLIAQRAVQQSQKSSQEVSGVSASFADIREELINNRVDTEERKTRLKEQIADPLAAIVKRRFPELEARLARMETNATDPASAQLAVDEANELLLELDTVLQRMLDLESYNELVELVRSLIEEQEKLQSETKKQQAAELLK